MEGIGNDYIYVNGFEEPIDDPARMSVLMSQSHFGCGSDGLILILPSDRADFRMRMFNNDGSESEMCGNGIRCVARFCYDRHLTDKTEMTVESGGGIKRLRLNLQNGQVESVRVDMGAPELNGRLIPSAFEGKPIVDKPLQVDGREYRVTLVNVGNPHAVTFVGDPSSAPVAAVGALIEHHPAFPAKINVEFARVIDRGHVQMRVWERGTGETLACGTGACAVMVASVLNGLTDRQAEIALPGGTLDIAWSEQDDHIYMTGPANYVYDGVWLRERL